MQVTYSLEIYGTLSNLIGTHALYRECLFIFTLLCDIPGICLPVLGMPIHNITNCNILISVCELPCSFTDLENREVRTAPSPAPRKYNIMNFKQ